MRNIYNAVSDVLEHVNGEIESKVHEDPNVANRWRIEVKNTAVQDSLLEIEILLLENEPVACVLQRRHIGRRVMTRFMDLLMDYLED